MPLRADSGDYESESANDHNGSSKLLLMDDLMVGIRWPILGDNCRKSCIFEFVV
jgi:hypothetical protein